MGRLLCALGFHRMRPGHHNIVSCVRCRRMYFVTCRSDCPDCRWERAEVERRIAEEGMMFTARKHRRAIQAVYGDILGLWAMCRLPREHRRRFIREALHDYRRA